MKERGIILRAHEVLGVLAGRQSQLRRVVRHSDRRTLSFESGRVWSADIYGIREERCPYGSPGDRLWVRETWKWGEYRCDDEPQEDDHECDAHCAQKYVYYAATPRVGYRPVPDRARIIYLDDSSPLTPFYEGGWKPSIHMPRWASRLTLEMTSVRVEQLKDISEEDAKAEGAVFTAWGHVHTQKAGWHFGDASSHEHCLGTARMAFANIWNHVYGVDAWDRNEWVWAISFKRASP
jgi:hypothetical protein